MFGSFGWMELLLILIIVLIIFGAGKIPQLGEGLGKAIKGFKKSVNEADVSESASTPEHTEQPSQSTSQIETQQTSESGSHLTQGNAVQDSESDQKIPDPSPKS